jgi:hypothetical protein
MKQPILMRNGSSDNIRIEFYRISKWISATFIATGFYTKLFKPPFQWAKPGNGRLQQIEANEGGKPQPVNAMKL